MKRIISLILAAGMIAAAAGAFVPVFAGDGAHFSDVAEDRWSFASVSYAVEKGYMVGTGENIFSPEKPLTRAMIATVLWRRQGSPKPEAPSGFSDVADGSWYADAVAWAKESGVVNGVSKTRFAPYSSVTREQLATMLFRFSSDGPVYVTEREDLTAFTDCRSVSEWAEEAMEWASAAGLVRGVGGNRLSPGGSATREQFAAIIERYDGTFVLEYNEPVLFSSYTGPEYPLVKDADFYVSTTGSDENDGSFAHPFATWEKAIEAVRGIEKTADKGGVTVAFMAGEYKAENVTMTEEDSGTKDCPVTYCAYGDGDVVFSGGVSISEDSFEPLSEGEKYMFSDRAADSIKKVDIGGVLPGYKNGDVPFGEDGVMTLARYPNKYDDGSDHLISAGYIPDDDHVRITSTLLKRRMDRYHSLKGLQLYGYLTTGWYKDTLDTDGYTVDEESGGYDMLIPDPAQARMGYLRREPEFPSAYYNAIALQNVPEELDCSGEYWVDADSLTMYVYEPHGSYTFLLSDNGLVMNGCEFVTLLGLTLTGYREKILNAEKVSGLTLDRCKFSFCSSVQAMFVSCRDVPGEKFGATVTGCDFSVFAGRVLHVNGNYLFDNNRVSRTNLTMEWHAAIYVNGTAVFSHNEFENCSYMAIGYNGVDNVIEYNVFKNCMYNSQDGGVIYCGQSQYAWGSVIRYNVFYPTSGDKYAVYLDDNKPAEEIYGNLFMGTTVCVHDGRSNNIHDNVMIRSEVALAVGGVIDLYEQYYESGDPNVFLVEDRFIDFYTTWKSLLEEVESDPVMKDMYFTRFPEFATLTADLDRAGETNFVLYPRNYVRNNLYISTSSEDVNVSDGYSIVEGNKCYTTGENPVFVNPTAGDYRIRGGVDFPDIHFENAGRY